MTKLVNLFRREGNLLYLDMEDTTVTYTVAIDSEQTYHERQYKPNEVGILGGEEDYLYYNQEYHSGDAIDLEQIIEEYNYDNIDDCTPGHNKKADLDASVYVAQIYKNDNEYETVFLVDWEKFYKYILTLLNKCDCSQCKPPLELITTILAYYSMKFNMINGDIARFIKVWVKTMKATSITNCGCNDR